MTKQEIEQAIENGESVWGVFNQYSYENDSVKEIDFTKVECVELHNDYFQYFNGKNLCGHYYKLIFKTKAEAEHYLHHANITRTEILPFLTWEEFKEGVELSTTAKNGKKLKLYIGLIPDDSIYYMYMKLGNKQQNVGEATEENFYKAYDECVRLFRSEEWNI